MVILTGRGRARKERTIWHDKYQVNKPAAPDVWDYNPLIFACLLEMRLAILLSMQKALGYLSGGKVNL